MITVKVSSRYEATIPKKMREKMNIKSGQELQVVEFGKAFQLITLKSMKGSRGFLKGINTDIKRENDRKL